MTMKDIEREICYLQHNDGITFKNFIPVSYKTGWQVGVEGIVTESVFEAMDTIKKFEGNCGVWVQRDEKGFATFYIDKVVHVKNKQKALEIGRENNQISIYSWKNTKKTLAYC